MTPNPPKYRHYRPKDLAVVRIDGKDHYLGKHGSPESWERYHRLLAERAAAGSPSSAPKPGVAKVPLTVGELILAFWKHAGEHYRHADGTPTDEMGNLKAALRPLRQLYGMTAAADFGPLSLRAVRAHMVGQGLARKGINDRVNRIRRAFKWAASLEMIPVAVVEGLRTVDGLQQGRTEARETDPIEPVPLEVVEATFPHLSRPVAGLVRLQLMTGMRPGEACAMRTRDFKPFDGGWIYSLDRHKTAHRGKVRAIPLGPKAWALIEGYLSTDLDAHLFRPVDAERTRAGGIKAKRTRFNRSNYHEAISRACDRAFPHPTLGGLKPGKLTPEQRVELKAWRKDHRWHPNQLRHTVATEVRARYGLEAAQVVLGHSKADVTQVYAERDLAKAREVMREIG